MARSILHPHLLRALTPGHFPNRCTIQARADDRDGAGQPDGAWSDVLGLANLPCADAPSGPTTEERRRGLTIVSTTRTVLLAGHFPEITTTHRAVIDGVAYNILTAEPASTRALTRLVIERVTP